ncbi:MAG: hypothetical protein K0R76_1605 [Alphaproteobacteria bacterium]|jgi:uncharacterized protein (DUF1778 family)|nr:hypothetical protein [Alphaproteobacteria bacterium]
MARAQKNDDSPVRKKNPRRDRLEARVAREQKSLFQKAADLQGKSLTEFLIDSAQQEAIKTIREYESIILGKEDQRVLMDALLNYKTPNKALRTAAKEYLEARQ